MAKADIAANDLRLQRGVLHLAAIYGHSDAIPTLLQLGASIAVRDRAGMTAMDVALQCGNVEVVLALKSGEMEAEPEPGRAQDVSAFHGTAA
jgi:ankyrin repeat protein